MAVVKIMEMPVLFSLSLAFGRGCMFIKVQNTTKMAIQEKGFFSSNVYCETTFVVVADIFILYPSIWTKDMTNLIVKWIIFPPKGQQK